MDGVVAVTESVPLRLLGLDPARHVGRPGPDVRRVSPVEGIAARGAIPQIVVLVRGARLSGSVKFPRQIEGPGTRENYE